MRTLLYNFLAAWMRVGVLEIQSAFTTGQLICVLQMLHTKSHSLQSQEDIAFLRISETSNLGYTTAVAPSKKVEKNAVAIKVELLRERSRIVLCRYDWSP